MQKQMHHISSTFCKYLKLLIMFYSTTLCNQLKCLMKLNEEHFASIWGFKTKGNKLKLAELANQLIEKPSVQESS